MILCKNFQLVVKSFKAICYFGNCQHWHFLIYYIVVLVSASVSKNVGYYIIGPSYIEVIVTFPYSSTAGVDSYYPFGTCCYF
jgi:hypothetical protein